MLKLSTFERKLSGRNVKEITAAKHAAVAVFVRFVHEGNPEVLLMRRAEAEADRWSGHVCFPGGKAEPSDVDLRSTAVRETQEELGFALQHCGRYLGPLDRLHAMARGRVLATSISPFVFVQEQAPNFNLGHEAAHVFWLPLQAAVQGQLDGRYHYQAQEHSLLLPCWRYQDEVIWGLTFKMLQSLLELLRSE